MDKKIEVKKKLSGTIEKPHSYMYRQVAVADPMYPQRNGIKHAEAKGYTNDCTKEEYKEHFNQQLNRNANVGFVLMRKKVVTK